MKNKNLKVIIATDSFKGSLTSIQAANAIERGVLKAAPSAVITKVPMADGGEGSVEAMIGAVGGAIRSTIVIGPLGEPVSSFYGVIDNGQTAVIEMAAASGLPLIPMAQRNPLLTTTYGTGELIRMALDDGCRRFIIGIGGSATNDGGLGMAQALGVKFADGEGTALGLGGQELEKLASIDMTGLDPRIADTDIIVMCDVRNPLCGSNGAASVYVPQKGATPDMIQRFFYIRRAYWHKPLHI